MCYFHVVVKICILICATFNLWLFILMKTCDLCIYLNFPMVVGRKSINSTISINAIYNITARGVT